MEETKSISPDTDCTYLMADHTSLESVQSAAEQAIAATDRLDIVICNAGIMGGSPGLAKDGYEVQFSVNYLSHALFISHLQPTLQDTAEKYGDARVVLLSSNGFRFTPKEGIVFHDLKTKQENLGMGSKWLRYGQSKLALVMYAKLLARHNAKITTVAIHPGVVYTALINGLPLGDRLWVKAMCVGQQIPLHEGAYNSCWAATSKDAKSGAMYEPVGKLAADSKLSGDEKLAQQLWDWTNKVLEPYR
jgi:NAD(P)-dependent dehydrogenase (short-subunit alcohol dehydrogenase family)